MAELMHSGIRAAVAPCRRTHSVPSGDFPTRWWADVRTERICNLASTSRKCAVRDGARGHGWTCRSGLIGPHAARSVATLALRIDQADPFDQRALFCLRKPREIGARPRGWRPGVRLHHGRSGRSATVHAAARPRSTRSSSRASRSLDPLQPATDCCVVRPTSANLPRPPPPTGPISGPTTAGPRRMQRASRR